MLLIDSQNEGRKCESRLEPLGLSVAKTPNGTGSGKNLPKVVSLFSGAGGLDLGFRKNGFHVSVAIDISHAAIKTHKRNFKRAKSLVADLLEVGPQGVLKLVSAEIPHGERIGLIGGPPCQGFSRSNAKSRVDDPRNRLASLYIEIVKALQDCYTVEFVVFENVLGIKDKKHLPTFSKIIANLNGLGFEVTENELCALDFGVPQNRRRIILTALRGGQGYALNAPKKRKGPRTVAEAIAGLPAPVYFERGLSSSDFPAHPNHWTMKPKSKRFSSTVKNNKSRSFRMLSWAKPSPTIAFGNREIHLHPNGKRRLSIFEALLLQGFPKDFILEGNFSEQVTQISNAVPPPLATSIAAAVKLSLLGRSI